MKTDRVCVFVMGSDDIRDMIDVTFPNKVEYCRRHSYSLFHYYPTGLNGKYYWKELDTAQQRLSVIGGLLKMGVCDVVFSIDADALVTNMTVDVRDIAGDKTALLMATDPYDIQMGVFVMRNHLLCHRLIERTMEIRETGIVTQTEQTCFSAALHEDEFSGLATYVPQRTLNAYNYSLYHQPEGGIYNDGKDKLGNDGQWQPGDLIFHVPGFPADIKTNILKQVASQVVR